MDLDRLLADATALPAATETERGFKGLALGVVYSLRLARDLDFRSRVGVVSGPDYGSELDAAGSAMASGDSLPREWLAGFYFNSALVRIAAGSHRALRVIFAPSNARFSDLSRRAVREGKVADPEVDLLRLVYDDINGFKHDGTAALLRARQIQTLAQAGGAASQLVALIRKAV